jgi:hypothetical protein
LATLLIVLATAAQAHAISAPIHIHGTGGEGVFIRPEPNTSHPAVGWMPEGASPDYHCFIWGQNINGVPIWFNVTYSGVTGYYASYYDDSSYHSNEELTAKYGIPLCGSSSPAPPSTPTPPATSPVPAAGGLTYSIVDADGGVYFRNSPRWPDTSATPGVGVYTGDRVELLCGSTGEAYGPYQNTWWSYVQNLSRSSAGRGWVNAHFINDGMPANQPSPGEPTCGSSIPGASGSATAGPPASGVRSAFYWPAGVAPYLNVADENIADHEWISGNCNPLPPIPLFVPESVNTLAGWSSGRLGPMYFLHNFPGRWNEIHTIILFDPGTYEEMSACDAKLSPSINAMIASWLQHSGNELLVLTGSVSEEKPIQLPHSWVGFGTPKFTGLWNYYFHDLWDESASVRARAVVCDYDNLGHPEVLEDFYQVVKASGMGFRPSGCPVSPAVRGGPTQWSP